MVTLDSKILGAAFTSALLAVACGFANSVMAKSMASLPAARPISSEVELAPSHSGRNEPGAVESDAGPRIGNLDSGLRGVLDANGRPVHSVTPDNTYTLVGRGFGESTGQVMVLSPRFDGGIVYMQVRQWSDTLVQVYFADTYITEVQHDFPKSSAPTDTFLLQVRTAAGQVITLEQPLAFVAKRAAWISNRPGGWSYEADLISSVDFSTAWQPTPAHYTGQHNGFSSNGVHRYLHGSNIDCPTPGTDIVHVTLRNNFILNPSTLHSLLVFNRNEVVGSDAAGHDVDGGDGSSTFTGPHSYGLPRIINVTADPVNQIHTYDLEVDWGVRRSHHSGPMINDDKRDQCWSDYFVIMSLVGPENFPPVADEP